MNWIISLNLGSGSLQRGCQEITARVLSAKKIQNAADLVTSKPLQIRGSLPPAPEIERLYRQWKLLYQEFYREKSRHSIREIKIESGGITYFSEVEFNELCEQLAVQLSNWLDAASFHIIDRKLRRILDPTAEIKVIIETNDPILRRLPWHLWNFFEDYPQAELALSTLEYKRIRTQSRQEDSARILAVFGNDRDLDLEADRQAIENLPRANTTFLESPQLKDLNEQLWDKAGWDILFFAGHSQTKAETGQIFINQTETISLEQLRHGLKKAIARGLKLAIFNSCDGLGLAQSLADLHIPQVIVMRESVPNQVAQEFFRYFLTTFAGGESLYAAVREARERLERLETEYPCATWLPVICQNPAAESLTWKSLIGSGTYSSHPRERLGTSISDRSLVKLLAKLQSHQPRVIGLDIYREFFLNTKDTNSIESMQAENNLITVCEVGTTEREQLSGIRPFPQVDRERSSFSDFPVDRDGVIRRQLLGMSVDPNSVCTADIAFSLKVAQIYLRHEGKEIERNSEGNLQIGELILKKLDSQAGGYQNVDSLGYQLLLNYRTSPKVAETISLTEIVQASDRHLRDLVKERIVLIGTTATSFKDYHRTPIGMAEQTETPGVMIHAHMVSQILSAVKDNRPLITWLPEWTEILTIWSCAMVTGIGFWFFKSPKRQGAASAIAILLIPGIGYVAFLFGWWLPVVPSFLAATVTIGTIFFKAKISRM